MSADVQHHDKPGEEEHDDDDEDDSEEEESDDDDDDETGLPGPLIPGAYAPLVAQVLASTAAPGIKLKTLVSKVRVWIACMPPKWFGGLCCKPEGLFSFRSARACPPTC